MNFRSVADLNAEIVRGLARVPRAEVVVGIPRSGALVASLLALHLQRLEVGEFGHALNGRKVLLVDDSIWTGFSLRHAKKLYPKAETLVVYGCGKPQNGTTVLRTIRMPRVFEWNLWRSRWLPDIAVDMDGVLCEDPGQLSDEAYQHFMKTAAPLYLPRKKVRAVITCRLERDRAETESWLDRHGVQRDQLVMMPYATPEERKRAGKHAQWKAAQLTRLGAALFVESSSRQALKISERWRRPVWCVQNQHLYGGEA